jgi:hypothetical protein
MFLPVFNINPCQCLVSDNQKILSILLFSSLREIERSGDYLGLIDDHDLIMGNSVLVVNKCRDPGVRQRRSSKRWLMCISLTAGSFRT